MQLTAYTPSIAPPPGDAMLARHILLLSTLLLPGIAHAQPQKPVIWGYQGGGNDDEGWGTLSHDFITCDTGNNQSPVAINEPKQSAMPPLDVHYHSATMSMERKDRTIVITMTGAGYLEDSGKRYKLIEMRMHSPAEHEVVGEVKPAEIHLIHKSADGKILILGIFADIRAKENPALQLILDKAPAKTGIKPLVTFNPADLLPESKGYYAYTGSLSWPPCTEGVEWRVMKDDMAITQGQMKAIGKLLGRNARLLQPLYLRPVKQTLN